MKWEAELQLYVVHGCLHLCGYDDKSDGPRREMRAAESRYMSRLENPIPDRFSGDDRSREEES